MNKAAFLDRDGTIIELVDLLYKIKDVKFISKTAEAIKLLNKKGFLVIIVTNQPVVARGVCDEKSVQEINDHIVKELDKKGARIDSVYYCPHHPDKGFSGENPDYKIDCNCRKPRIELIERAVKKFDIDLTESFFVGDTTIDVMTGHNAGLKTILLKTGFGGTDKKYKVEPDYKCETLYDAAEVITR